MSARFSSMAFSLVAPILAAARAHPFNTGLAKGTLPQECFVHYLRQSRLLLEEARRAFVLAGGRGARQEDLALMLRFAQAIQALELSMLQNYFKVYKIPAAPRREPACQAYASHLLERSVLGSFAESAAALLPCFWLCGETDRQVFKNRVRDNPYQRWIESLLDPLRASLTEEAVELLDELAAGAGEEERRRMIDGFVCSCRLEYAFRDDAFHLRVWPV